jgi:hypothetical protein
MMEHGQDVKSLAWHPHEEVSLGYGIYLTPLIFSLLSTDRHDLVLLLFLPSALRHPSSTDLRSSHPRPTTPTST